jgi:hypothetical protein
MDSRGMQAGRSNRRRHSLHNLVTRGLHQRRSPCVIRSVVVVRRMPLGVPRRRADGDTGPPQKQARAMQCKWDRVQAAQPEAALRP